MNTRFPFLAAAVLAGLVAVSACTLGPEPERPTTAADVGDSYTYAPAGDSAPLPEVTPWWREFGDETTTELVELALAHNTDLRAAAARVLEAEATLERAGGARLPQVGYGATASKQRNSFVLPNIGRQTIDSTTYSYNFNVSWQADLFGRLKRTQQSTWASLLAEEAAREAVVHSVVAAVVRARVLVATTAWALDINRQITASWERTTQTVDRRYRAGIAGAVELHLARENLASAHGVRSRFRRSARTGAARARCAGRAPPRQRRDAPEQPCRNSRRSTLCRSVCRRLSSTAGPICGGLRCSFRHATYGVGAAIANLYPDLSLTGLGRGVRRLVQRARSDELRLQHRRQSDRAPVQRRPAPCRCGRCPGASRTGGGRLRGSCSERAPRGGGCAGVSASPRSQSFNLTTDRVAEARAADSLAKQRYQRGVETLLTVLETERRLRLAEQAIITSTIDVWNARIDLFLALGGDWGTDPADAEPEATVAAMASADSEIPKSEIRNPKF